MLINKNIKIDANEHENAKHLKVYYKGMDVSMFISKAEFDVYFERGKTFNTQQEEFLRL